MSPTQKRNLPASVLARLLQRARRTGDDYQVLLGAFITERFLYRLGVSSVRNRFVLKGAMLLRLWSEQPYRSTRDLDLLRRGDSPPDAIRTDVETICGAEVEPDAVTFDRSSIRLEPIRPEDEYAGTRVTLIVEREGRQRKLVSLVRREIVVPSVSSRVLPGRKDSRAPPVRRGTRDPPGPRGRPARRD